MTDPVTEERFRGGLPTSRTELRLYRDRLEYDRGGLRGLFGGSTTVPYDSIDLVVRRDGRLDGVLGSASYDLLRSGEPTVRISRLTSPDEVERTLDARVPGPRERVETPDADDYRTVLQHQRVAWRRWPADEPLPRSAVVTDPEIVAQVTEVERPERPDVTRASDGTPSGVTPADFQNGRFPGGGSGGDADFTGGSTRQSPGHVTDDGGVEANADGGYSTTGE